jgi:hypothetical protein
MIFTGPGGSGRGPPPGAFHGPHREEPLRERSALASRDDRRQRRERDAASRRRRS